MEKKTKLERIEEAREMLMRSRRRNDKNKNDFLPDEEIQKAILNYLAEKRKKARGIKGVSAKFSEIEKAIKNKFKNKKLTKGKISHNLDLLVQFGWIAIDKEEKKLKSGMIVHQSRYKLSPEGIKYTSISPSRFIDVKKKYFDINISTHSGMVIIGDRNIAVYQNFNEVAKLLEEVGRLIGKAQIPITEQTEMISEIQTIESQLLKEKPTKEILKTAFKNVLEKTKKYSKELRPVIELILKLKSLLGV